MVEPVHVNNGEVAVAFVEAMTARVKGPAAAMATGRRDAAGYHGAAAVADGWCGVPSPLRKLLARRATRDKNITVTGAPATRGPGGVACLPAWQ
eukprot:m.226427 g.226427  ORF g.226427 m.226427 type:complete len:94 (+) comp18797_c0_seq1:360-641(+)